MIFQQPRIYNRGVCDDKWPSRSKRNGSIEFFVFFSSCFSFHDTFQKKENPHFECFFVNGCYNLYSLRQLVTIETTTWLIKTATCMCIYLKINLGHTLLNKTIFYKNALCLFSFICKKTYNEILFLHSELSGERMLGDLKRLIFTGIRSEKWFVDFHLNFFGC